ncbi:MAG: polyphosphate kinase 1 [Planctomycetes bacterium]|nr:polyphosphate kinase 1 [Planctomycetota bacterium]MBL7039768.1 polyphosphate kinase 1 [Pirellulaceae bacterium]
MGKKTSEYVNRELTWLEFNQRVLDEATDDRNQLLDRLRFLAITASNLDEFFMVRVGGLQILRKQRSRRRDPAGMTPLQQLRAISQRAHRMVDDQYACLSDQLQPELAEAGIRRVRPDELDDHQRTVLQSRFDKEVFTVYTPMAIRTDRPFPPLSSMALNVCVRLAPASGETEPRFAVIPFGNPTTRFFRLPAEDGYQYILLEDVVRLFIQKFFPGETVLEIAPFRITRNADLAVREDMASDLMAGMEKVLDDRKESSCVRLEVSQKISDPLRRFLCDALRVTDRDNVYLARGPLDLNAFMRLTNIPESDSLREGPWRPQLPPDVDLSNTMFDEVRGKNIMLSLPYESFEPVVRLVEDAAADPDVLAIKIILYRTSRDSPIVAALQRASEMGKHVTALVELKARFDEARNIEWARNLEQAGAQVIYGVKKLKTHAKVCIIVRRETHGIQRYVHFATGNYNEVTAKQYSDISFLTCDEDLAADASSFFNAISGYSQPQQYRKLAAAPFDLRDKLIELIEGEIDRRGQKQPAHIMAQLNSLACPRIIEKLYEASKAGVKIDLNIRGICCLKPGVPDLSDNIRVVSILDRYLEHSRIIYFRHGGDDLVFISSADWMPRNLDKRIELMVPIEDPASRERLIAILESYASDTVKGREIRADGGYDRPNPDQSDSPYRHQEHQYRLAIDAQKGAEQSQRTMFEPHQAAGQGD